MAALKLRIKKFDEDLRDLCESDGEDGFMLSLDDRTYKRNPPPRGPDAAPAGTKMPAIHVTRSLRLPLFLLS